MLTWNPPSSLNQVHFMDPSGHERGTGPFRPEHQAFPFNVEGYSARYGDIPVTPVLWHPCIMPETFLQVSELMAAGFRHGYFPAAEITGRGSDHFDEQSTYDFAFLLLDRGTDSPAWQALEKIAQSEPGFFDPPKGPVHPYLVAPDSWEGITGTGHFERNMLWNHPAVLAHPYGQITLFELQVEKLRKTRAELADDARFDGTGDETHFAILQPTLLLDRLVPQRSAASAPVAAPVLPVASTGATDPDVVAASLEEQKSAILAAMAPEIDALVRAHRASSPRLANLEAEDAKALAGDFFDLLLAQIPAALASS